jgi:hypothetical protein
MFSAGTVVGFVFGFSCIAFGLGVGTGTYAEGKYWRQYLSSSMQPRDAKGRFTKKVNNDE